MSYDKAEQLARDVLDGLLATIDRLTARVVELERDRAEISKESNRLAARVEEYADTLATGARNLGLVTMERDRLRARVEELDGLLAAQRSATDLSRDDIATLAEIRAEIREFGMFDDESAVDEAPRQTRALVLLDRLLEAHRE